MEMILGKLEVYHAPIDLPSFVLGAILGFLCSLIAILLVILIIWLLKSTK
jgi:hypothetical protein